jgi:hypothetical protein
MKRIFLVVALLVVPTLLALAEDLDGRSAFLTPPGRDVGAALKRAESEKKRVLVFVADPARKVGFHIRGTMEAPETKKMVKESLIVVFVPNNKEKHVAGLVDDVNPMHPGYVVFNADGTVLEKGDGAMGAAKGLEWIKKLVATP